jgi:transposase
MYVHATSNEAQAAAIARRLIDEEGRNATVWNVTEHLRRTIRTQHDYAVVVLTDEENREHGA